MKAQRHPAEHVPENDHQQDYGRQHESDNSDDQCEGKQDEGYQAQATSRHGFPGDDIGSARHVIWDNEHEQQSHACKSNRLGELPYPAEPGDSQSNVDVAHPLKVELRDQIAVHLGAGLSIDSSAWVDQVPFDEGASPDAHVAAKDDEVAIQNLAGWQGVAVTEDDFIPGGRINGGSQGAGWRSQQLQPKQYGQAKLNLVH